jgi:hypothetical protein
MYSNVVVVNAKLSDRSNRIVTDWIRDSWVETSLDNFSRFLPCDLILACGVSVPMVDTVGARLIELPHPDYIGWTPRALAFAGRMIRESEESLEIRIDKRTKRLIVETLVPF